MQRPPRPEGEALITPKYWRLIFHHAAWMTLAVMGALTYAVYMLEIDDATANTMTFYALVLVQLCQVFNLPERGESFWRNSVTTNKYIWIALPLCLLLLAAAYAWPVSRNVLQLQPLDGHQWLVVILTAIAPLFFIQSWNRLISRLFYEK